MWPPGREPRSGYRRGASPYGLGFATAAAIATRTGPTLRQLRCLESPIPCASLRFVDGSGWREVYDLLKADGLNVSVVQNQTLSLESDIETTRDVLDLQHGPAILVGHSYGGVVITEAGRHERVGGLVYIAAFAPDAGESVNALIAAPAPGAPVPPILPPQNGFLFLDREKFADSFAADLPAELAAFMADSQVPWGV